MAYSTGGLIEAQHYNQLVWGSTTGGTLVTTNNNLNYVWGPGYGNRGLNQDMSSIVGLPNAHLLVNPISGTDAVTGTNYNDGVGTLTQVDSTLNVKSQQWIGLMSAINRGLYHQNQSNVALSPAPAYGGTIKVISGLQTAVNNIAGQTGTARNSVVRAVAGGSKTFSWIRATSATNASTSFTRSVSWSNGNNARWFFNAGGKIRITASASTASGDRSAAIVTVINDLGACDFGFNTNSGFVGADPGTTNTNKGYWNIGTSYVQLGKNQSVSGSTYPGTYVAISARLTGDTSDGAVGSLLEVKMDLFSDYGGTGADPRWGTDNINVSVGFNIDVFDPSYTGGMLTRNWADPDLL
jgi:hypothetical protein